MKPRRIPGAGKGTPVGRAAEASGGFAAHPDGLCRRGDDAGISQHLNKAPLFLLRPAIIARAAADRHPAIVSRVVGFRGVRVIFADVLISLMRNIWRGGNRRGCRGGIGEGRYGGGRGGRRRWIPPRRGSG